MKYLYTLALPAPGAADVVRRELHVVVNGEPTVTELAADVLEYKLELVEDADVEVYLVDIDDAGNLSDLGELLAFTVIDTVPPPAPGRPEIIGVEEVAEPVAEEPVVEEPVAEEPVVEEPVAEEPAAPTSDEEMVAAFKATKK